MIIAFNVVCTVAFGILYGFYDYYSNIGGSPTPDMSWYEFTMWCKEWEVQNSIASNIGTWMYVIMVIMLFVDVFYLYFRKES